MPAGRIRPCAVSSPTLRTFTRLHVLRAFRGVKRIVKRSSSTRRRTPSIQPWQSASSTDSDQVSDGLPVAAFQNPTSTSVSVAWCSSSQAPKAAGESKYRASMRPSCRDGPTVRQSRTLTAVAPGAIDTGTSTTWTCGPSCAVA
jgi:hypothetical protein